MLATVAAPHQSLNPVRTPVWNGSMRAGDDLKIAFTLLDDDCETPLDVGSANARMTLFPEARGHCHDYGACWGGFAWSTEVASVPGGIVAGQPGRINFFLPAASTVALCRGRYRLFIEVDQPDGLFTEIEGILQVRETPAALLGNAAREYLRIGVDQIGKALLPPMVVGGVPLDENGFPLRTFPPIEVGPPLTSASPVLGIGVVGSIILGSAISPSPYSSTLGQGVVGEMTLGTSGTTVPPSNQPSSAIGLGTIGIMMIGQ